MAREYHKPLSWIKQHTVFPMSAGRPLVGTPIGPHLLGFQRDMIKNTLSPQGRPKKSLMQYGCRKVGKSLIFSGILWYFLNNEDRFGEVWPVSASTRDQAQILYDQILSQIKLQDKKDLFKVRQDSIQSKKTETKIMFLGSTGAHNLGLETQGAVLDQIESHRSSENLQALETAGAFSDKFLRLYSMNPPLPGHFSIPLLKNCERRSDQFNVYRFSLPFTKDWTNEDCWISVNPFLAEYRKTKGKKFKRVMQFYREQFDMARDSKEYELSFRRMLLGQALSSSGIEFIPQSKIHFKELDKTVFKRPDIRWSAGFDPSVTHDFSSLSIVGYSEREDQAYIFNWLYLPNTKNRTPTQKKQFLEWSQCDYLSLQDRDVLDPQEPIDDFYEFVKKYKPRIECVTFDQALSGFYLDSFKGQFKTNTIKMTAREMTSAIRRLERCGNSEHGITFFQPENPCIRWQFDNILISQKSKHYCLLDRVSDELNIDCPVSLTLAFHYLVNNKKQSYKAFIINTQKGGV